MIIILSRHLLVHWRVYLAITAIASFWTVIVVLALHNVTL